MTLQMKLYIKKYTKVDQRKCRKHSNKKDRKENKRRYDKGTVSGSNCFLLMKY